MIIATFNVNSVRQRLEALQDWLRQRQPDVVCLQEIKCQSEAFPREPFEELGYALAIHGQKTFNGVAVLSKYPLEDTLTSLDGEEEDTQARYLETLVALPSGVVRVVCLYLPNGNPVDSDKYPYKLRWMDRLIARTRNLLTLEEPLVLAGDYNVIPEERDARTPDAWREDALFLLQTREKFRTLINLGLTDAFRAVSDAPDRYSFWDYQAGAWQKNNGIRIDHLLLSPQAADRLVRAEIDHSLRAGAKPSDHVPVWADLNI